MEDRESTLSKRGAELASGPNMRDQASQILGKQWHPIDNPDALVNIGTAENHLMLNDVAKFIESQGLQFQGPDFDYGEGPWGSLRLRKGLSKFVNEYFSPHTPIDPEDITCTSGCSSLFNMLSLVLGDPGDGILLSMPSYVAFSSDFGSIGKMKPIFVPFGDIDQFSPDSITCYEATYANALASETRIRALMLCNPHNPLGRCYPASTLTALMQFCNKHSIHLLADEVYAQSVYDTSESNTTLFTSVLSLDYEKYIDKNYLHFIYGMSKDFACGGLRIGFIWTKNQELKRALSAINVFHWPGQIDERVAVAILESPSFISDFLSTSRSRLAHANALAKHLLDGAGIPYALGANAGFFLWVNLSAWLEQKDGEEGWKAEGELMGKLIEEKVFITPGKGQASEMPGWFRLVFSHEEVVLREGIRRLAKCLGER